MSADVETDIMNLMAELGLGEALTDIYTPMVLRHRNNVKGILVEQRNTSPVPDVLTHSDTLFVNVQVRGGLGDAGKQAAADKAMDAYRKLNLILDRDIGGTHYLLITPDSAPYPVEDGDYVDFLFGLEIKRYYGEIA